MKFLDRLFNRGLSKLQRANAPDAEINSDDIPDEDHQSLIRELADEYLKSFCAAAQHRNAEMDGYFEAHPLLGLEVCDEALVVLKNNPNQYQKADFAFVALPGLYRRYNDKVTELRGGRPRATTTPTLRRGGKRTEVQCDVCSQPITRRRGVFSSDDIRRFVANGFVPDEADVAGLMKQKGFTLKQATDVWCEEVVRPARGPWSLCGECAYKARQHA